MLLSIDKSIKGTIFDQIVNQVRLLIERGDLAENFEMPSTRQLASSLGINRSTVVRAYEELWSLGYLESTQGSYTRVRKRKPVAAVSAAVPQSVDLWNERFTGIEGINIERMSNYGRDSGDDAGVISFERLEPDARLINRKAIAGCFRDALDDTGSNIFGYCPSQGFEPLREAIASHMRRHSINTDAEDILITNGTQSSLQLIFQSMVDKGDYVAVEMPTYSMVIPLIRYYGCKVCEIPMLTDGPDLDVLREVASHNRIKMFYTTPSFQNPTGITMTQAKREELLDICCQNNILIIEDSIEEELKYFGRVHLPVKSIDTGDMVIYLGTFSKILAPGLRLGWIIAGRECIRRLTALKTIFDLSANTFSQMLMYRYCISGQYELHIRKCMRVYRKRMTIALKSLKKFIPAGKASWDEPLGGYLIWIRLKVTPGTDIIRHIEGYGVKVTCGNDFFAGTPDGTYIRLSIAQRSEAEIEEGMRRLGMALEAIE